ncbi:MAG TPA: acyl-CoA dehydrogenase [Ilumatobacter sp.]|nr:acyl-CoA dehydrogenase [Ilumatobacter sp.]
MSSAPSPSTNPAAVPAMVDANCARRVRRGDERLLGGPPVDLRHGARATVRLARTLRRGAPRVACGELHVAFGVTEPDAGTDTTAIRTRAVGDGDDYLVSGAKVWTTKAPYCELCLLLVRTTPREECAKPADGMTLLLVDLQRPEVDIRPIPKLGRNAVVSCEVRYDNLRVPVSRRIGEEGKGFTYLLDGLNPERILLASEALGIGRASINKAVAYGKDRVVFGRPIGQNQGLAFPLAKAHMHLRAAELAIREASWRFNNNMPCGEAANGREVERYVDALDLGTEGPGNRLASAAGVKAIYSHTSMWVGIRKSRWHWHPVGSRGTSSPGR